MRYTQKYLWRRIMSNRCPSCGNQLFTLLNSEHCIDEVICDECEYEWKISCPKPATNDAGELKQSVQNTLKQRQTRYGDFDKHSKISQAMKMAFADGYVNTGKDIEDMPDYMWEAMSMICHKLARVANGDHMYDDNWRDIAGYAELVVKELNKD